MIAYKFSMSFIFSLLIAGISIYRPVFHNYSAVGGSISPPQTCYIDGTTNCPDVSKSKKCVNYDCYLDPADSVYKCSGTYYGNILTKFNDIQESDKGYDNFKGSWVSCYTTYLCKTKCQTGLFITPYCVDSQNLLYPIDTSGSRYSRIATGNPCPP